jgi:hypothetical protein
MQAFDLFTIFWAQFLDFVFALLQALFSGLLST